MNAIMQESKNLTNWTSKDLVRLEEAWNNDRFQTKSEVAEHLGIDLMKLNSITTYLRYDKVGSGVKINLKMRHFIQEYDVYKGDTFVCSGTAKEVAEQLDVKPSTVACWSSPSFHERYKGKRGYIAYKVY